MKICSFFIILTLSFFITFNCRNHPTSTISSNESLQTETINEQLLDAVNKQDTEKVKRLLEKGANPNAFFRKTDSYGISLTVLGKAVESKNLEIARLLLDSGANIDKKYSDYNEKNFDTAVNNDDTEMAKLLVEYHANIGLKEDPSHIIFVESPQMLDYLISLGFDINSQNMDGRNCLIEAVFAKNLEMVKAILKYKPNLNLKTKPLKVLGYKEMTALQIAKAYDNKDIIKELKKAGAK